MKKIQPLFVLLTTPLILLIFSCNKDEEPLNTGKELNFDFKTDAEGWEADFAEYPVGEDDFYELEFNYTTLPEPLDQNKGSLMLSGNNHSDDLFMFITKKVEGLARNTSYKLSFEVEFASNVPDGMSGIGGSPGESVFIKAGASPMEPEVLLDNDGRYMLNIDKGNQSQNGEAMMVIGDFSNNTDKSSYTLKTINSTEDFNVTSNSNGELWLIIGTDSGFEGSTRIYYNSISVKIE